MFKSIANSRFGKYYASVLNRYGKITPFAIAIIAFMILFAADSFGLVGSIRASSGATFGIATAFLCVCAALMLFYFVTKLGSKRINAVDLATFVFGLLAVLELIQIIVLPGSTARTVLYVVALVFTLILTVLRVAVTRPESPKLYESKAPNATVGAYFKALVAKYNPIALLVAGVGLFALVFFFDAAEIDVDDTFVTVMALAVSALATVVLLSLPSRISSKRVGQVDAVLAFGSIAVVLCVIPLCFNYTAIKLVAYLAAFALVGFFDVLIVRNTYIEKCKPCPSPANGKRGVGAYFKAVTRRYNVFLATALGILGFVVLYCAIAGNIFYGASLLALNAIYAAMDVVVLAFFAAMILSARGKRVSVVDYLLYALSVFAILALIPTVQYFSVLKLIGWILLVGVLAFTFALRVKYVTVFEEDLVENYDMKQTFAKDNVGSVASDVKKLFVGGPKDAHYISGKESRRIARENMRITKGYEKAKKRKNVPESEYVTKMRDDRNIVEFDNLHTYFFSDAGVVKAVNGVTFDIPQGSTVGVIGESGCGKSVTSLSLMQLVQAPKGQIINDENIHSEIRFKSTVYKEDEHGKNIPVYEVELDENGNEKKDADGNPVYVMAPKMHKGKPVLDKDGKPVLEKVQKKDVNGIPLFETEEKVYNVAKMPTEVMRKIRGREIAMIFQEPMTSLNPIFTIGNQLDEVVFLHIPGATKESAKARTYEMLRMVGIIPENVYKRYPHELSGGMRQRVMIAMALSCNPKLIIADEPTTALDVTIQAQILDLLREVKQKINGSIMFITHDLGVIAEMADYVVVMYAGRIIEMGTAKDIFDNPLHPYTMGLQKSKPAVNKKVDRLYSIPGSVPNPIDMPNYCYFRDRCDRRCSRCNGEYPEMIQVSPTHKVSCHLYEKEAENGNS